MMVGVNGVGKTTSTAKLASKFKAENKCVMLAACDTFRAAAIEQLQRWGERIDVPVIAQSHGSDAAAVGHDALESAISRQADVLIVDTAGRQHTHGDLMEQLAKVERVMKKIDPTAPHEVLLTVDAATGQNALTQVEQFNAMVPLTGLIVTKLDGTAKGGIVIALAKKFALPIRFIGVGEGVDDLREFDPDGFVAALLPDDMLGDPQPSSE
jgi:fused signal recognition particle receptor